MNAAAPIIFVLGVGLAIAIAIAISVTQQNDRYREAERKRQRPLTPEQMAEEARCLRAETQLMKERGEYELAKAEVEDIQRFVSSRKKPEKINAKGH
jgi:uncharacterized protein HemX